MVLQRCIGKQVRLGAVCSQRSSSASATWVSSRLAGFSSSGQSYRRTVDLRSDTVTLPSPAMKQAMVKAPLGDDVYEEDPTVHKLERTAASMLGKEAALFVSSGTMGNLISIAVHCERGDEIILGYDSHIHQYEAGGCSVYLGVTQRTLPNNEDGSISLEAIRSAIREDDVHYPRSRLVALENTQNRAGGKVLDPAFITSVATLCQEHDLHLHMDGARLMNAAVATKCAASALLDGVDSVSLCLSKGLGAPVGSIIAGREEFIRKARRVRKSLGGGMRQAGIIAAAGLYALENNVERLADDHRHAKELASALSAMDGVILDPAGVETNIIYFQLDPKINQEKLLEQLAEKGVLVGGGYDNGRVRAVTNLNVSQEDVEYAIDCFKGLLSRV